MDKSLIWSGLVHTPVPILKFLAKVASTLHYHMDRRHVEECQKMVQATEKGWNEVKIVKSMYHSLWQIPADMSYFGKISENELFEVIQELDHFLEFLKSFPEDKGVIFVAAHLGPSRLSPHPLESRNLYANTTRCHNECRTLCPSILCLAHFTPRILKLRIS